MICEIVKIPGRSLVAFLVQTGVADSPGEAVNLADSYLRVN